MNRQDFNKLHPVGGDYSAFLQTKQFMKENAVIPPGEVPLPVISEKSGLTRDEAAVELQSLYDIERPQYGFLSWLELKITHRIEYLRKTIADFFLKEQKDGN